MHKDTLRQQALARRRALSAPERTAASDCIQQHLLDHLSRAAVKDKRLHDAPLLLYRALGDEVDTHRLLAGGGKPGSRNIYAPVTHHTGHMHWRRVDPATRWQRGDFGVLEPSNGAPWSPREEAAIVVCPLVGFDRLGNRLGLGKGCFDRWLDEAKDHILLTIGLAFACQECPPIPAEAHDIPLDTIITEGEIIACRNC